MSSLKCSLGAAGLVALMIAPAAADQRSNSRNHGPSTHVAPTHPNTPPSGPKGTGGSHSDNSPKGNSGTSHGPDSTGPATKHTGDKSGTTSTTATTSTSPTTINFATAPLGAKLTRNTALQSKLAANLSSLGYSGTVF